MSGMLSKAERREARRLKAWPRWLKRQCARTDLFTLMRHIERSLGAPLVNPRDSAGVKRESRPRIGDSASRADELIPLRWADRHYDTPYSFGQDPWMMFPGSNVLDAQTRGGPSPGRAPTDDPDIPERVHIVTRFLGLLGAQGPLPIHITEEAREWLQDNNKSFTHFLDIINNRFIQLFFRAWADSRPIVQNDRPDFDRFQAYIKSFLGVGSTAFESVRIVPDGIGVYAGLLGPQAKSASRLRQAIRGLFGVKVEIDEFVGSWLVLDVADRSRLGGRNSGLGDDLLLGAASFSVHDKIRLRLFVSDLDQYARFLPEGGDCDALVRLMYFYVGDEFDWDVELALPAPLASPTQLGAGAKLGWTSWVNPQGAEDYSPDAFRCDARFHPAQRQRQQREKLKNEESRNERH